MRTFGHFSLLFFFVFSLTAGAVVVVPNLPNEGVLGPENRGSIDPNVDYERFSGRVSDKDDSARVFKIHVENNNTKFFRAGDSVLFKVNLKDTRDFCKAFVRNVEDFHFTIYVESLGPCYSTTEYFRRGTVLNFYSKTLALRVFEASKYRDQLILRKEDFLKQLNDINHFLWTFDQQKVKTAADYDEQINRLQREKRKAIDDMITLKQERLVLQNELMKKLNELDESLLFYRVERQELMTDRWQLDHDQGLPVGHRPQDIKQ
ncbi:hypothetical protein [Peredibacter starrii]|uniref:Uncharacterized protein n=1 Tax=Peredibacter starrii TaxID=28202 RepID=A0AAX4HJI7_9BACT|nr:hypothetical protein [Peredibacter starrii]WPU63383.1 hypothetical protein SOO65_11865 [Peredibacter starrii]